LDDGAHLGPAQLATHEALELSLPRMAAARECSRIGSTPEPFLLAHLSWFHEEKRKSRKD
jgi:hypothetical protein